MTRHFVCFIAVLLILPALLFAAPAPASAHAYVKASDPKQESELDASPERITVTFTENIDTDVSKLTLSDENGKEVPAELSGAGDNGLKLTFPKLADGVYKVRWQVLSVDSHVTEGTFRFSVGVPLAKVKPQETVSLDDSPAVEPSAPSAPEEQPPPASDKEQSASSAPKESTSTADSKESASPSAADTSDSTPSEAAEPENKLPGDSPQQQQEDSQQEGQAITGSKASSGAAPEASGAGSEAATGSVSEPLPDPATLPVEHTHHHSQAEAEGTTGFLHTLMPLLRIMEVLTLAVLGGLAFFRWLVHATPAAHAMQARTTAIAGGAAAAGIVVFLLTGITHILMLAEELEYGRFGTLIFSTTVGQAAVARVLLAAAVLGLFRVSSLSFRTRSVSISIAMLCLIVTFPWTGHAFSDGPDRWLTVTSHTAHIAASIVWFGGILGIVYASFAAGRDAVGRLAIVDALTRTFSRVALPMMVIVFGTGFTLSLVRLPSLYDLAVTPYGRILFMKIVLFVLILLLAGVHRWVVMPRMSTSDEVQLRRLIIGVRVELAMALALFTLAGVLSTTSPT
ncbi:copper resistance CopC/CopD family protein [Paenibacillus alkalitolerans]|uniref:copper resistance CopC/CopD family protein n=1 Tax=Paenibacillus alkalitolerans TaxID=2799335 RepID=UPI0018F3EFFE|nr:copper resistance protein CopC [Paenibacillus alkalitolerans]